MLSGLDSYARVETAPSRGQLIENAGDEKLQEQNAKLQTLIKKWKDPSTKSPVVRKQIFACKRAILKLEKVRASASKVKDLWKGRNKKPLAIRGNSPTSSNNHAQAFTVWGGDR